MDMWFCIFKGIIIFLWLLAMVWEFRDIVKILTLCARFPSDADYGEDAVLVEQDPSDPEDVRYRIQGITMRHRLTMVFLSLLRAAVTCVLTVVGVSYLIKTNAYTDLIMNGVALAFIAEISSVLYDQVLRAEIKDQTEDIKSIKVMMYGWDWLNERPALIDMLCVLGITIACYIIIDWQKKNVVVPVHTALGCTCLSEGDKCFEAQKYNVDWWHDYWLNSVPAVFQQVADLKSKLPAELQAASYLALGSSVTGMREMALNREEHMERLVSSLDEQMEELVEFRKEELAMEAKTVAPKRVLPQQAGSQHRHAPAEHGGRRGSPRHGRLG